MITINRINDYTAAKNRHKLTAMQKYLFRIQTKSGQKVDNLVIHGTNQAHAEMKLRQMYHHCDVLEIREVDALPRGEGTDLESAISLIVGKDEKR